MSDSSAYSLRRRRRRRRLYPVCWAVRTGSSLSFCVFLFDVGDLCENQVKLSFCFLERCYSLSWKLRSADGQKLLHLFATTETTEWLVLSFFSDFFPGNLHTAF
jgi:hypothetical protein